MMNDFYNDTFNDDYTQDLTPQEKLKQWAERRGIKEKTDAELEAERANAEERFRNEQKKYLRQYVEELETAAIDNTLAQYFENNEIYDTKWLLDKNGHYNGVILMLAMGGPAVYVDTFDESVSLHFGSLNIYERLNGFITDRIADYFEPFCPFAKEWR